MLLRILSLVLILAVLLPIGTFAAPAAQEERRDFRGWINSIGDSIRNIVRPSPTNSAHATSTTTPSRSSPARPSANPLLRSNNNLAAAHPLSFVPFRAAVAANSESDGDFDPATEIPSLTYLETAFGKFERKFDALPKSGEAPQLPWTSTYWPSTYDGINYRWKSPEIGSPVEKYAIAFNISSRALGNLVSKQQGIDAPWHTKQCVGDFSCASGDRCVSRRGSDVKLCVADWEGICDGWTAASIMMPEPRCAVTFNGVKFNVADLKGLMSAFFASDSGTHYYSMSMSGRCNVYNPNTDRNGYYSDPNCGDATAGMFHIFITNMLGRLQKPFAFDRETTGQVWNQPVHGYQIIKTQNLARFFAQTRLGFNYKLDPSAVKFVYVELAVKWISEVEYFDEMNLNYRDNMAALQKTLKTTSYEYVLELNAAGEIIGGGWVNASKNRQPDFMWVPTGVDKRASAFGAIKFTDLEKLWAQAVNC
ncbi:uncharacterized protein SPPG_03366 [Spizellomyces punctatus DAOM BR117]|uniref:Uncharacterized protein n=1 Tax=Spizellomyces punctatus (strain DAOM BR117) TaxID=645134 RepID=A0A0L0HJE9_SPIPD|nr:uncharacterized protein SPPG_03366 [Spizellomyces punctatus DAOM BR117]KND01566.1 hypothetical protein SPPG_03366 [Spizellomyces punctatus DAOM BR117]|eukprot:XP_016609605.1 hypothetical protein SPPG_03366 [Spizellomyces punctatus DAOM BR117]